jgi:hypothetical protein
MAKLELFQHAEDYVTFRAGTRIFEEGQPGDSMYAVVEGEVDIVSNGKVLETTGAGGIAGSSRCSTVSAARPRSAHGLPLSRSTKRLRRSTRRPLRAAGHAHHGRAAAPLDRNTPGRPRLIESPSRKQEDER